MKKRLVIITFIFAFVFAIIINKMVNERNLQRLDQTFSEIYEDRLLVESYIYQLTDLLYKKKIDLLKNEGLNHSPFQFREMQRRTSEMLDLTDKYALTRLTENERQIFGKLEENIESLRNSEVKLFAGRNKDAGELERICELSINQLKLLSSIQVSEGSLLNENGRKVLSASHLAVQLEWAVFLVTILIFFSILRKKKMVEEIFPKHQLN